MRILVIDGQGGGIGSGLIEQMRQAGIEDAEILAVGTNVLATSAMLRAGGGGRTQTHAVLFGRGGQRSEKISGKGMKNGCEKQPGFLQLFCFHKPDRQTIYPSFRVPEIR